MERPLDKSIRTRRVGIEVFLGIGLTVFAFGPLGQDGGLRVVLRCGPLCHCRCVPCCMQCCTVMKTCMVTEYTYQDMTAYKIVYEDVETPVNVPAVEYQPAAAGDLRAGHRARAAQACGQCQPASCPPTNACDSGSAAVPGAYEHLPQGGASRREAGERGEAEHHQARRRAACAVHADALHSALGMQAGAGAGLLPRSLLLHLRGGEGPLRRLREVTALVP